MIDKGVTQNKKTQKNTVQLPEASYAAKRGTTANGYQGIPNFTDAKNAAMKVADSAFQTVKQKANEVNAARSNVQRVLTDGAGIYERLQSVENLAKTDKSSGTQLMLKNLQSNYKNFTASVAQASRTARLAEKDYTEAYKRYETAVGGYDTILKNEKAGMDAWRKSIRPNYDQISVEIAAQQARVKDAQKKKQQADSALAEISARRSSMLDGAMVFPGEEESAKKAAQNANNALQEAQKKLGLLQEERAYSRYLAYDKKQSLPDFAEKSQYKTTATGGRRFNALAGVYTDTGFGDILYDYINGNEEARTRQDTNSIANNTALMGFDKSFLREMTKDEVSTYNYVYATEGKDAAERYIGFLTTERNLIREGVKRMKGEDNGGLTQRQTEKLAEKITAFAVEHPKLATAAAIAESPLKGLSYVGQTADYMANGKIDQYARYNMYTRVHSDMVNTVAQKIAQDAEKNHMWGKPAAWAYQLGVSMAEFLLNSMISGASAAGKVGDEVFMKAAEAMSLSIMGTGAAADSVIEAKERGLDDDQAYTIGSIAGLAEVVTEKVSIENLFSQEWEKSIGKYIAKNIIAEGSEEMASDLINLTADILIAKDKSEWAQMVNEYTKETGDPNKAFGKAVGNQLLSIMLSGLGGAISGGLVAGFHGTQSKMMQELYDSIDQKNLDRVVNEIAEMAENMPTIQTAQEAVQPEQETLQPQENVKQESVAEETTKPQQETVADTREEGVLYGSEERLAELAGEQLSGNSEQVQQSGNSEQLNQQKTAQQTQQQTQTEAEQTAQQTQKATETIKSDNAQEIAKQAQREALSLEDSASKYNVDAKMVEAAKRFQAQTGRAISYFRAKPGKSGTVDGFYDRNTNTIFINASSTMQQAVVFGHELTHSIEKSNIYKAFSDLVFKRMGEMGQNVEALRQDIRDLYAANGVSYANEEDLIDKEIVAKFVQDNMLTNEEEIRALVRENRKTAQRVKDWIDRMLAKFGNKDAKERAFLTKAREMYAQALEETKPQEKNEQAISEEADKAFSEATEDEKKKRVNDLIEQQLSQMSVSTAEARTRREEAVTTGITNVEESEDVQFGISALARAAGFEAHQEEDGTVYLTKGNKRINEVTVEDIDNSAIGALINFSYARRFISEESMKAQKQLFADLLTMAARCNDFTMSMQFAGSTIFTAIKSNADSQYKTTYDFVSICTKTQAVIDAMSSAMVEKKGGLTEKEIKDIYNRVVTDGNPVPCPECYVFSRWVGIGGLLDNIWKYQNEYGKMTPEEVRQAYDEMAEMVDAKKAEMDRTKKSDDKKITKGQAKGKVAKEVTKAYEDLKEKIEKADKQGEYVKPSERERLEELEKQMITVKAMTWIDTVYFADEAHTKVNDRSKWFVPKEILFDLNQGEAFAEKYKDVWAFRTTQGAGYGKAITPYAEAVLGEGIMGTNSITNLQNSKKAGTLKNAFLDNHGKLTKAAREKLATAIKNQNNQAFLGGQRFQSTSDARNENAFDYLIACLEVQAMNGMVQAYTKVAGAVPMFDAWGFSGNMSLMPKNGGLENGKPVDTNVGGMDPEVAIKNRENFEHQGTITIGVNDNHIRAMLEQDFRDFIIPYHASGGKGDLVATFRSMQEKGQIKPVKSTDYTKTQSDKIMSDELLRSELKKRGVAEKDIQAEIDLIHARRQARIDIFAMNRGGKAKKPDMEIVRGSRYLSELYRRLSEGEWKGVTQAKATIEHQIFPNEFWDTSVTYKDSGKITRDYLAYCEELGFLHRFSGQIIQGTKDGPVLKTLNGYDENGERVKLTDLAYNDDGSVNDYFWKLLTDRRMYDNQGNYMPQQRVSLGMTQKSDVRDFATTKFHGEKAGKQYDGTISARTAENVRKAVADGTLGTQFSISDSEYAELAKDPEKNEAQLQQAVDEAARAAGYDTSTPLYHGTGNFGFKNFDLNEMDDGRSIFTTSSVEVAESYSGKPEARRIQDAQKADNLDEAPMEDVIRELSKVTGSRYAKVSEGSRAMIRDGRRDRLRKFVSYIDQVTDGTDVSYKPEVFGTVYDVKKRMQELARAKNPEQARAAFDAYEKAYSAMKAQGNKDAINAFEERGHSGTVAYGETVREGVASAYKLLSKVLSGEDIYQSSEVFSGGFVTREDALTVIRNRRSKGVYALYGRKGNNFSIDCAGGRWSAINGAVFGMPGKVTTRQASKWAKNNGYDSITFKNLIDTGSAAKREAEASDVTVFFNPKDLKSADPVTYDDDGKLIPPSERFSRDTDDLRYSISQDEYAPTFYSQMERTISEIKQPKLGAANVVSYLRGRGVKAEEIKWSGIEEWLEGKKSVTREELAEFAAGSRLQIEEEKFGRGKQKSDVFSEFVRNIGKIVPVDSDFDFYEVFDDDGNLLETEFAEGVNKIFEAGEISEADKKKLEKLANEYGGKRTAALSGRPKWNQYATPRGSRYREIIFRMPGEQYENPAMITHWGRRGILAHARIQDMKTDSGTMLFVDEIQSDWHNEGHRKGYREPNTEYRKLVARRDEIAAMSKGDYKFWHTEEGKVLAAEYRSITEKLQKEDFDPEKVKDAPFSDTYQDFVMKRLIREAAENGYDSVGWTTAEMQSRRFSAEFAEGYRIEYDQQIPSFLKKYGKKWGGKVTQTTIPSGDTVWQFRIPEEMKKSVLHEGQPQFSISIPEDDTYTLPNGKTVNTREYLRHIDEEGVEGVDFIYTYKSMSYWGEDENGNAILRSPMAEFSEKNKGSITDAYIVSKDPSRPNWYKAVEEPSKLVVKVNVDGKVKYLPVAGNENLIAEDWSNLYYPLIKKNEYTGELENPTYARYNPYEHSSNLVLNDQFDAGYRRPNLVTVKMKVPLSEGEAKYRAKYSKDQTGWTGWKSGKVAGRISQQKEGFKRDVYLSRYAAPVEIMPNSWVAQKYKEYMEGTDVEVPDNVVSPDLLEELIKAGVPIKKKPRPKFMEKAKPASYAELERYMSELKSKQEQTQFAISEDEKMQQDWDKVVRDRREIAVMTGELAQAQEDLANDMAEAFQRQTDKTIGETMERTGNFPQRPAPKRTQKEEARSFIARKFIDSGDAVSQMGKKAGDKTLYNYYSQARRSSAAAYSMINKAQTNIRGERVGDSLQAIFDGIKEQWGEEYYKQLELLLLHRHNINRMSREKPMELKAAREEFRAFTEVNYELAAYAEYEIERMAREPDSYYHHEAQEYIELRDNMRKLENTRNKAVFNWDVTAQISNMVCQTLEERLRQVNERFEDDAKKIYAYIDNLMQYRIDSGLMTEQDYESLKKIYPNYVPVYRMVSQSEQDTRERRKIQIGKTVGRAVGGEESIMSLGKALEKQTFSVVREGSKNRWGTMLLDRRYARSEEILGVESQKREFHEDTFDELEDPTPKRNNTFTVRNSGEVVDITVSKELFEAVNALAPERVEENAFTKTLRAWNDLFKKMVTSWNPGFIIRNASGDFQDALLYSNGAMKWLKNYPQAYEEMRQDGKYWQQYQALGGVYSGMVQFQNPLDSKAPNAWKRVWNFVEVLNQAVEQAPRLAEFMRVCKSYGNERLTMDQLMEAMEASAEVTVNFGRSGTWGKVANAYVAPFLNPGIQGFDKAIRTFTDKDRTKKEWAKFAVKCAILGILPGFINAALWGDDDEYEDIKERDKDTSYLFKLGDGKWLKIKRGRVISIMQSATRRTINTVKGKENAWDGFVGTMIEQVAPANPLTQNIFAAWIEARLFDKDNPGRTWFGGNIESQRLQGLEPGERYDASTDEISKRLGKLFGLSPKKINYLLDEYTGVVGDLLLPTLSQKGARNFFAKQFIIDSTEQNRLANDFYKMEDKLKYAKNSSKGTELDEILYKFWSKQSSQISDINKAIRGYEEDPTLSKSDKEAFSRIEMQSRNTAEKTALETLDEYRKAAEKYLKQSKLTDPEDRIEEAYREANREVMGADYAIRVYNKQVYDKACGLRDRTGITMDQFYDFYFPFKAIEGKGYQKSNAERDLIASLNLSEKQKIALYQEYVSQSRDDDIQAFADAGMKFKTFVAAQNAYSEINANGGTAGQKRTEFARWAYGQKLTDEQRDVVMDSFTFYSNIPADTGKYEDFRGAGMDDKTSYAISKALTDLKPLDGKSQVSEVQKMEAITSQKLSTEDQIKAISVVASESTVRKIKVASEHYVEPKMYADVWKRLPEFDADGNGSYKNAEIQAAIDAMGDYWKGTGTMDNAQKAVMWQLLTGNKSAKNNPYSRAIGQEVLDAINALKTAAAEEEE